MPTATFPAHRGNKQHRLYDLNVCYKLIWQTISTKTIRTLAAKNKTKHKAKFTVQCCFHQISHECALKYFMETHRTKHTGYIFLSLKTYALF